MPDKIKCPNCDEEIPMRKVEDMIDWHDVVVYQTEEYEIVCPYCSRPFYVEVLAEPHITVKK